MNKPFPQPGILAPVPRLGRSLSFRLAPEAEPAPALRRLRKDFVIDWGV